MKRSQTSRSSALFIAIVAALAVCSIRWLINTARADPAPVGIYTQRFDNTRMGWNANETILTPASVGSGNFGKIFSNAVDGYVIAEPLYVPLVDFPNNGTHNAVYVATEHDSIYAFDADAAGAPLAQLSLLANGETTLPPGDTLCQEITNEIGVTDTPVIDPATRTLYVVARSKISGTPPQYIQRLHALDIATLAERPNFPVTISASVAGTGCGQRGWSTDL